MLYIILPHRKLYFLYVISSPKVLTHLIISIWFSLKPGVHQLPLAPDSGSLISLLFSSEPPHEAGVTQTGLNPLQESGDKRVKQLYLPS